jgi:putative zinc finger/helix-turn-helix YgiT family protein
MKCPACQHEMQDSLGTHAYRSLPGVTLVNVPVSSCPRCGEREVEIPAIEELHQTLRDMVVSKAARLTGAELQFLRKYLGLSKEDLALKLAVSPDELAAWERGSEIPVLADRFLRLLAVRDEPASCYPDPAHLATHSPTALHTHVRFDRHWQASLAS